MGTMQFYRLTHLSLFSKPGKSLFHYESIMKLSELSLATCTTLPLASVGMVLVHRRGFY